jgi:signal transduction histidine kinase
MKKFYTYWYKLLVLPKSKDDDHRRREFILNVLLISSTVVATLALVVVIARYSSLGVHYDGEPPLFAALQVVLFAGLLILSRKGFFVPAAYALVIIFYLLAFQILVGFGILMPQGILLLSMVLIMASILLGTRVGFVLTFLAAGWLIILGILQHDGAIHFSDKWMKTPGGLIDAIGFGLILSIITTISWLSNRELERFNIRLQTEVNEATKRLRAANKNLQVLDKAKDDFISMASHQLGTPLTAITGYLSMALDEDKGSMSAGQREYVTYAMEAAERMTAMSLDLLNVSRLSSGRFIIQRQPVDLATLIDQEVHQLGPAADRKQLKLLYTPPSKPLPMLQLDESKTRQVVMNFIDNAIYYTGQGQVAVALEQVGDRVRFTVTDTGIGVPESEKSRLFAKFYRAENAKHVRPDGTGLGIYLAKTIIEDQGGTLIFESTEGKGSTFGFFMPIVTAPTPPPAQPPAA